MLHFNGLDESPLLTVFFFWFLHVIQVTLFWSLYLILMSFSYIIQFSMCNLLFWLSTGGDNEIRTHDPLLARQVLSQLSYTPTSLKPYTDNFILIRNFLAAMGKEN